MGSVMTAGLKPYVEGTALLAQSSLALVSLNWKLDDVAERIAGNRDVAANEDANWSPVAGA